MRRRGMNMFNQLRLFTFFRNIYYNFEKRGWLGLHIRAKERESRMDFKPVIFSNCRYLYFFFVQIIQSIPLHTHVTDNIYFTR